MWHLQQTPVVAEGHLLAVDQAGAPLWIKLLRPEVQDLVIWKREYLQAPFPSVPKIIIADFVSTRAWA